MDNEERLKRITAIIECVENRCMAVDGTVPSTLSEITLAEFRRIYILASTTNDLSAPTTTMIQQIFADFPMSIQFTRLSIEICKNYILAIYDGPTDSSVRINNLFNLIRDEINNEIQRRIKATEN